MEYVSEIVKLTQAFYNKYDSTTYPEILSKSDRPYNCLLIDMNTYYICLPYRTHINHRYSFTFKNSVRSRNNRSGIDYSKMIIITNDQYINASSGIIDQDEYNETIINIHKIVVNAIDYLQVYIDYKNGNSNISEEEYLRRYGKSTLPYFDKELGLV